MSDLYRKVGETEFDNLITGLSPALEIQAVVMLALVAPASYPKGTVLGIHTQGAKAGKCVILGTAPDGGEAITPSYILAEDVTVGVADLNVAVYSAGCFAPEHVTAAAAYTLTESDLDLLRTRNIVFKSAFE